MAQLQGQIAHHVGFRLTRHVLKQHRLLSFQSWSSARSVTCKQARPYTTSSHKSLQEDDKEKQEPQAGLHEEALDSSGLANGAAQWSSAVREWPPECLDSGLFVVPTPIGNLGDITLRALRVLRSSSLVLAEDTRHTRKLLNYYGLRADTLSCHDHNEKQRVAGVMQRLKEGQSLALVSDAGMPGISDPGHAIIAAAVEAGVRVIPLPGACAFVSALVASGLPTTSFSFHGFLPPKSAARRARLSELRDACGTLVFYAPPHGLIRVLGDMVEVLGGSRKVCIARELTKVHEEFFRSTLQGALEEFSHREPRGEICIVLEGADGAPQAPIKGPPGGNTEHGGDGDAASTSVSTGDPPELGRARPLLAHLIASGVPMSAAAKDVAKQLGVSRKELYNVAMQVQAQILSEKRGTD